jgi:mRNA interferase MazF
VVIQRGEIWWADLPEPAASEPGYRRPVLVVQSDDFNRSRIATAIVVVITSNLNLAQAPGNVLLPQRITGLPKDSVANISQVLTIDKSLVITHNSNRGAKAACSAHGSPSVWRDKSVSTGFHELRQDLSPPNRVAPTRCG